MQEDSGMQLSLGAIGAVDDVARANRDALAALYRSVEAGDMAALAAILADDVRFWQADGLPYAVAAVGKDAALAGLGATFASWRSARVNVKELAAAGDMVFAYMSFDGVALDTGRSYRADAVEVFRFRDGKVIELRPFYWDTHAARAALVD